MEWKMYKKQLDILLGRWELPDLSCGVSTAVFQLLESELALLFN